MPLPCCRGPLDLRKPHSALDIPTEIFAPTQVGERMGETVDLKSELIVAVLPGERNESWTVLPRKPVRDDVCSPADQSGPARSTPTIGTAVSTLTYQAGLFTPAIVARLSTLAESIRPSKTETISFVKVLTIRVVFKVLKILNRGGLSGKLRTCKFCTERVCNCHR